MTRFVQSDHSISLQVKDCCKKLKKKEKKKATPLFENWGFPGGLAGKELAAIWETWVNPWVGKIPWRREQLPTPVFWPGEFHGLYIAHEVAKGQTQLSAFTFTL